MAQTEAQRKAVMDGAGMPQEVIDAIKAQIGPIVAGRLKPTKAKVAEGSGDLSLSGYMLFAGGAVTDPRDGSQHQVNISVTRKVNAGS